MDFGVSEEQRAWQLSVRDFAQKEVAPVIGIYDREERYPTDLVQKMAPLGWLGGVVPEVWGGAGMDYVTYVLGLEEMARACIVCSAAMSRASGLQGGAILKFGDDDQRRDFLIPLARGEIFGSTGLTEPHSGTDVAAMETTARRDGDDYVINGAKIWISGVGLASWYLTFAQLDKSKGPKGITAFIVPADTPGLIATPFKNKLGFRRLPTGELSFTDVRVPASLRIGPEGAGLKVAMCAVENGRLGTAARAVGLAQACLDASVTYAGDRVIFGEALGRKQLIQAKIADMVVGIEAARLLTLRAAWLKDSGATRIRRETSAAKLFATEVCFRTTVDAGQIFGAYAISDEYEVSRHFRDARVLPIVEGANEQHRVMLAEYALGYRKDPVGAGGDAL